MLSGTTTTHAYNADGQQLNAKQGSTTVSSSTWNGAGQLTAYSDPAESMTAAAYNGDGLRASSTTGGTNQAHTWNVVGSRPRLIMDSANAYIYDGRLAPVEQVNLSTGAIAYLVTDSLGSVRGVISSAGSLTGTTSYDAWGNPETVGGLSASTPFGYAGGYTDPTGLIYLVARYYQPGAGQFISVDPELSTTGQPYSYGNGDPIVTVDPTGPGGSTDKRLSLPGESLHVV